MNEQQPRRRRHFERMAQHTPEPPAHEPEHAAEHQPERRRRRRHSQLNRDDPFYVNLAAVPKDTSVEWKRFANVGEENPFYLAAMREQGWEPVNPQEHPDWVPIPPGYDKTSIIKEGLILMERPMELTKEAQDEARQMATRQVVEAEQRLGKAPKDYTGEPQFGAKVVKEVGRMIPIED